MAYLKKKNKYYWCDLTYWYHDLPIGAAYETAGATTLAATGAAYDTTGASTWWATVFTTGWATAWTCGADFETTALNPDRLRKY